MPEIPNECQLVLIMTLKSLHLKQKQSTDLILISEEELLSSVQHPFCNFLKEDSEVQVPTLDIGMDISYFPVSGIPKKENRKRKGETKMFSDEFCNSYNRVLKRLEDNFMKFCEVFLEFVKY